MIVIGKEESALKKREARILGRLSGYGNACDAFHQTASSDDGEGAYLAMRKALGMAGLSPADISYVNAHGTGTPNNDVSESQKPQPPFGSSPPPVSSTKGMTATPRVPRVPLSLSSACWPCATVSPANVGWHTPMVNGITPVSHVMPDTNPSVTVMCNSFGFGGNDSSLIISYTSSMNNPSVYIKSATSDIHPTAPSARVGCRSPSSTKSLTCAAPTLFRDWLVLYGVPSRRVTFFGCRHGLRSHACVPLWHQPARCHRHRHRS